MAKEMTNYVAHRVNTLSELKNVPREYGVEIDLRESGNGLILQHDPFVPGENFEEYIKHYKHGLLILNIKCERIEDKVREIIRKHEIKDYFFLDSSFPMIIKLSNEGENNLALRFSEFERLDTIMAMRGRAKWVWVDCFTELPIDKKIYASLKEAGFLLCLVSPELQGRESDIIKYREYLKKSGIIFDAICTKIKNIPVWGSGK